MSDEGKFLCGACCMQYPLHQKSKIKLAPLESGNDSTDFCVRCEEIRNEYANDDRVYIGRR